MRDNGPKKSAAVISGITMKKLKMPMYTPIRSGGIAVERIAYGIERIDAHAIPTPTIVRGNRLGLWMTYVESSPTPPHTSAAACTAFRLVASASFNNPSATTKQVSE